MPEPDGSRIPVSCQCGPHPAVTDKVDRHLSSRWQAPVATHNHEAFEQARQWRQASGAERPLMLDSGCGTALSSVQLAESHPHALVIALDQSRARLTRARNRFSVPDNLLLLRAECADFWRLARARGWSLERHYLLYPNPWPKPGHLARRWHGHPVFPDLLALGGVLEVRSNWRLYLEEMALALERAGPGPAHPESFTPAEPATDFERKYHHSGHSLYRLRCDLDGRGVEAVSR